MTSRMMTTYGFAVSKICVTVTCPMPASRCTMAVSRRASVCESVVLAEKADADDAPVAADAPDTPDAYEVTEVSERCERMLVDRCTCIPMGTERSTHMYQMQCT